jgi:hypothetical protein
LRGEELVDKVRKAKKEFGPKCPKKFGGAAAIQILREALRGENIVASQRDVFVRDSPVEIDLIVPRAGERPSLDLLYEPNQVAVALEVKKSGVFGETALKKIRRDFAQLRKAGIHCAYVTFEDRKSYRWKATSKNLGAPCFTLAWHKDTDGPFKPTSDWERLVKFLRRAIAA